MGTDEPKEEWLDELVGALQKEEPANPEVEDQLMARIRAEAARTMPGAGAVHGRGWWNWLSRPRRIALSPLGFGAAVLGMLLLALGGSYLGGSMDRREAEMRAAAIPRAEGTRPVLFTLLAPQAHSVSVAGDFNNWDPAAAPLELRASGGVWAGVYWMPDGVYSYSYVVDGRISTQAGDRPSLPAADFGGSNSVLVVGKESI
jgi:hypothetical protein